MYAVIFRAQINGLDESYSKMAKEMRALAMDQYGCSEFIAVTEEAEEVAISYWQSLEQIELWKQDARHLVAQKLGKSRWYNSYKVEVVEILRGYDSNIF